MQRGNSGVDVVDIVSSIQNKHAVAGFGETCGQRAASCTGPDYNVVILGGRVGCRCAVDRCAVRLATIMEFAVGVSVAESASAIMDGQGGHPYPKAVTPARVAAKKLHAFLKSMAVGTYEIEQPYAGWPNSK
jgi:hypothetical protein